VRASPQIGIYFEQHVLNLDDLLILPDSASEMVIENIRVFWSRESEFRKYGFLWKRGILLWGPPGSGKTCTLQLVAQEMIKREGVVVYANESPELIAAGLRLLRQIESKRSLVVMLEDLDAITQRYGESQLLSLLDGELQIDNVVFIATTNYPEMLDRRLINRPSRFDVVKKIGMPGTDARRVYLQAKNPRFSMVNSSAIELERWVKETNQFSIAHLKELIVLVEVFGISFNEAIERLRAMIGNKPSSGNDDRSAIGFAGSFNL
jgi:ATP-dependent 26S proteasome regulatory subunit